MDATAWMLSMICSEIAVAISGAISKPVWLANVSIYVD
jgi:hypothetical protein